MHRIGANAISCGGKHHGKSHERTRHTNYRIKPMYLNKKVPLERKGNTQVHNDDKYLIVTLYRTNVFVLNKKAGTIALSSGGWRTVTTKQRINQAADEYHCGFGVYQKDFEWYVTLKDGNTVPFVDGMKLDRFTGSLCV